MGEFGRDLDYFLWVNVQEESSPSELVSQHLEEWPEIPERKARVRLQSKLVVLISRGQVGVYRFVWSKPDTQADLDRHEAVAIIQTDKPWEVGGVEDWYYCLFPLSDGYAQWPPA